MGTSYNELMIWGKKKALKMARSPQLHLKTSLRQSLAITQNLRQALKILQMPQLELAQWLREEVEKNPLLELETPLTKGTSLELPSLPSLQDHIMAQIRETFLLPIEKEIAIKIFEDLDEKGFITKPLEHWNLIFDIPVENIIQKLQTFDPPGIFARNLQECLLIQLREKNEDAYQIIQNHFEDLLKGRFKKIDKTKLNQALQIISHLNFRPASLFHHETVPLVKADLSISKIDKNWMIETIEEEWPTFTLKKDYIKLCSFDPQEKQSIRQWTQSAHTIFHSLKRRQQLLIKIGTFLVQRQKNFLDQKGGLEPLTIQELAKHLSVHESTISRALDGKYAMTPRGFLPLHALICVSPLAQTAKQLLEKLISQEDKKEPMTDEDLMKQLQLAGIKIARRTIVKYRHQLKIKAAPLRKYTKSFSQE
jgi:RNA polymerase sigma-54 factor